jgi:DNA-binding FadR family transcriptional regulator
MQAMVEHAAIVDAIAARESDAAAYAMRHHLLASIDRFRRLFTTESAPDATPASLDNIDTTRDS